MQVPIRVVTSVAAVLAGSHSAIAADLLVPQQFSTIQLAVNAAATGDRVLIDRGQYEGAIDLLGKSVTLQAAGPAADTVLVPAENGVVLRLSGAELSPTFRNLTFTAGVADRPVQISGGDPVFERCIFRNNRNGAAVDSRACGSDSGSTFRDCLFSDNSSPNGGAIYLYGANSKFLGCAFVRNIAQGPTSGVNAGGSVYVNDWGCGRHTFTFRDCTFVKGSAVWGGSI